MHTSMKTILLSLGILGCATLGFLVGSDLNAANTPTNPTAASVTVQPVWWHHGYYHHYYGGPHYYYHYHYWR